MANKACVLFNRVGAEPLVGVKRGGGTFLVQISSPELHKIPIAQSETGYFQGDKDRPLT